LHISTKMKKNIEDTIEIPENMNVEVSGNQVIVKSSGKEAKRVFGLAKITMTKEGNKIKLESKNATKKEATLLGTCAAHIRNMIQGMKEDFVYKLEVCNVHFPMTVKVEGKTVVIKTFLGEVDDRIANIVDGSKVEIKGKDITVSSFNKEAAGQTAANIETATKVTGRDRRVFQDGIFITEKCGKAI